MNRRELILQELGLWPVWVPRERAVPPPAAAPEAALEGVPGSRAQRIARMDWPALKEAVRTCTACALHAKRQQAVFGVGDERADWLFVGEGPGAEEDARGEPFVGQAGRLLDNMLAAIGLQRGRDVYIANTVKCLRYNARIQLGDGRWERIGRLVASRYSGTVMSVDHCGRLVPRPVVGWHASPLAGRRVFRLSYESSKEVNGTKSSVQLTGDHPVLTARGWIAVEQLREGDLIATGHGLSDLAFDVVCGTLLGDGHLNAKSAHLTFSHSKSQLAYAQLKAELLAELRCCVNEIRVAAVAGEERRYEAVHVRTRAHRALSVLRAQFYGPTKRVPPWIEARLNDRMLAFWFMDDAYTRIRPNRQPGGEIATCAFSDDDLQVLLRALKRIGISGKAHRGRIYFDVAQTRSISERIAPFVPPAMRYKLHPDVAVRVPFDAERLTVGPPEVIYDKVDVVELIHTGSDKTFYCLDVEGTHNFVTSGGVVHNCRPPGNRVPEPGEAAACEPFLLRQIALVQPRLIVALGKTAASNLLQTDAPLGSLRGRLHDFRGVPLLVTYHPAYLLRTLPDKAKAWEDLCLARDVMQRLKAQAPAPI